MNLKDVKKARKKAAEILEKAGIAITPRPKAIVPKGHEKYFTIRREIVLRPGDQFAFPPDNLHWFQAGDEGAVLSEFSSMNTDAYDLWTNPNIRRIPAIEG